MAERDSAMKKQWKRIGYIAVGIILLVLTVSTGQYGLGRQDKEVYEMACEQQANVDKIGFRDFRLSDYPLAYYDGDYDYVLTRDGDSYQTVKRKSVLDTFAGTAYFVEDHYEIVVPTMKKFRMLADVITTAEQFSSLSSGEAVSFEADTYGEKEQVSTIWHEAFHAYQFTCAEDKIQELLSGHSFGENDFNEGMIVDEVDSNTEVKKIYEKQLGLLKQAVRLAANHEGEPAETDIDTLREIIIQYKQLDDRRRELLSDEVLILEEYYERVEGSAYYVEGRVYETLYSGEAFDKHYVEGLDIYQNGSGKYYGIGMAQCRILDALSPDWATEYDFSEGFMDLIYARLGV